MSEHATISTDILARYAADAAQEVNGVRGLVESHLPRHRGVRITDDEGRVAVEVHLAVEWGASIPAVGREVQQRIAEYLQRMADVRPAAIDVVVDEVRPR
ncbi:MAG: Asp23/Gls24 family envelope stress response protein [Actinobacteria bacterium]|nr:MAG: Asp23/Gls24 family envelope stress response protein [Actinomycetota bacterium]